MRDSHALRLAATAAIASSAAPFGGVTFATQQEILSTISYEILDFQEAKRRETAASERRSRCWRIGTGGRTAEAAAENGITPALNSFGSTTMAPVIESWSV